MDLHFLKKLEAKEREEARPTRLIQDTARDLPHGAGGQGGRGLECP
jgi:hypothetical protein